VNILPIEKQCRVIAALTEGCSIRSTSRLVDVHKDTIMRLGVRVGEGCERLHDSLMRNLHVGLVEMDEQWSWVSCRPKHVQPGDSPERGACWLFVALDATSKAIVSFVVGKRNTENTHALAADLHARLLNRPQITSDGWGAYPDAINEAFGRDCDFATLTKQYAVVQGNEAAVRYSPGSIRGTEKRVVCGDPDPSKISTSFVERFNLSTRMGLRRFTRLTNAFSKKLANHRAAIALHIAHYNFCRIHETLRCTPAMAVGVADHPWTIEELLRAALAATPAPVPAPPTPLKGLTAGEAKRHWGSRRPGGHLAIIKGGRR
jgi:IS1 family transposase